MQTWDNRNIENNKNFTTQKKKVKPSKKHKSIDITKTEKKQKSGGEGRGRSVRKPLLDRYEF